MCSPDTFIINIFKLLLVLVVLVVVVVVAAAVVVVVVVVVAAAAVVVVVVVVVVQVLVLSGPATKNIEDVHRNEVKKLQSSMICNRRH